MNGQGSEAVPFAVKRLLSVTFVFEFDSILKVLWPKKCQEEEEGEVGKHGERGAANTNVPMQNTKLMILDKQMHPGAKQYHFE